MGEADGRGWPVAQGRVRPDAVVGVLPKGDHGLGFLERVKDFLAQALVPQLAVEALTVPVLPRRARRDVLDLRASFGDPFAQCFRDHLRAIVAADVLRDAMQAHGVGQRLDHTEAVDAPRHLQREACPAVLIDQRQDAKASPIVRLGLYEVEAPDVVAVKRP